MRANSTDEVSSVRLTLLGGEGITMGEDCGSDSSRRDAS